VVNLRRGTTLVTVDGFKLLIASYLLKVANFNLPHHAAGIEAPAIPTPTIPTPVIPTVHIVPRIVRASSQSNENGQIWPHRGSKTDFYEQLQCTTGGTCSKKSPKIHFIRYRVKSEPVFRK